MRAHTTYEIRGISAKPPCKGLYKSVKCSECGKPVSEHPTKIKDGQIVCIPCYKKNNREGLFDRL
ncbi:MAG: TraR/DksA C4-type zinc finger protein [Methanobacteriales archaeon]|nr:TraR/DksA C4-type zinc finger protein [Methanobacteriales archaeon]